MIKPDKTKDLLRNTLMTALTPPMSRPRREVATYKLLVQQKIPHPQRIFPVVKFTHNSRFSRFARSVTTLHFGYEIVGGYFEHFIRV